VFRRGGSPAARSEGRRGLRSSRRSGNTKCRGLHGSETWVSTRTRGGGGGVTVDGEVPVTGVGEGVAQELQCVVGKVLTQTIGSVCVGLEAIGEDSGGGGEDRRRRASGRQYRALKTPRRGRRVARR
jgi:hypothetical protein